MYNFHITVNLMTSNWTLESENKRHIYIEADHYDRCMSPMYILHVYVVVVANLNVLHIHVHCAYLSYVDTGY